MHISYPSAQDVLLGVSPCSFIMVHGQPNFFGCLSVVLQRFNWTDGCTALKNSDIDEFMALVNTGVRITLKW